MKATLLAAVIALSISTAANSGAEKYTLDASHSQIIFSYNHMGFSTTWGMFSGFSGVIMFDAEDPAASGVSVSMPLNSMFTGWGARDENFMGPSFFDANDDSRISFLSTGIAVTGKNRGMITGDLSINGVTRSVVLDTVLNQAGDHPITGNSWLGFNATTSFLRSDYGVGGFAPLVGDKLQVMISVEARKAE